MIKVPPEYVVHALGELTARVFQDINDGYTDKYFVLQHAILAPKDDNFDKIIVMITERFPGVGKTYLSVDTIGEDDVHHVCSTAFYQLTHSLKYATTCNDTKVWCSSYATDEFACWTP